MHAHYNEVSGRIESFIAKKIDHDSERKQKPLQLEKVKMPLFTGEIRDYPRFKMDFEKQVMPTINIESAPYILRSCLSKGPADVVKSIDDDYKAMWKRLDEKYGDPTKVVDVIMNAIHRLTDSWLPRLKEIRTRKGNNYNQFCERDRKEITDRCQERMGKVCKLRPQHC